LSTHVGRVHALKGFDADRSVSVDPRCMDERSTARHRCTIGSREPARAGYATALIGKAHFEPFMDPSGDSPKTSLASLGIPTIEQPWFDGRRGVHRGSITSVRHPRRDGPAALRQVDAANHPESLSGFYQVVDGDLNVNARVGGDTGAPQVKINDVPREWYHTDWSPSVRSIGSVRSRMIETGFAG